jgi:two-component system, sensor histidine kinase and response regulator
MASAAPSPSTWSNTPPAAVRRATCNPSNAADAEQRFVGVRILLVDDQQLNQEVASELLARRDVVVDIADNGQHAIDMLTQRGPGAYDLVLMDIEMPILDGLSATRLIRTRPEFEGLPIVALTAHLIEAAREEYAAAGLDDQLGKPFTPAELYKKVARWVNLRKQVPLRPVHSDLSQSPEATTREFDWANALARFGNRQDRLNHWLRSFVAERRTAGQEILARIDNDDLAGAGKIAHALKGVSGTLGLLRLHHACSLLEADLISGRRRSPAMVAMQTALARAIAHVERHLTETNANALPPTSSIPPMDADDRARRCAALGSALTVLRKLLAAGDGASEEHAEHCLSLAAGVAHADDLRLLLTPIRNFDFATALQILDRVAAGVEGVAGSSSAEGTP